MQFERINPVAGDSVTQQCHEMYLAAQPIDDPDKPPMSRPSFVAWMALGWSESPRETWLARDASGQASGYYCVSYPERENTQLAHLSPLVGPALRRRGTGMALVTHAAGRAKERGRTRFTFGARQGSPGEAFCRALGASEGITEADRVLQVPAIPAGHLAALRARAQAAARGYRVESWQGQVPRQQLAAVASLTSEMNDAPMDEWEEGWHWDEDRVLASQARVTAAGLRYYTVAALHERTGELVGLTQLGVDPLLPRYAHQEMTAVARAHRGHRLGLLIKVAMLDLLADHEPQLERVYTGNAASNKHMIAINDELGFTVIGHWVSFELGVTSVLARQGNAVSQS